MSVDSKNTPSSASSALSSVSLPILRQGPAARVIFFYPGEEGTFVENAKVTLYANGIVHITTQHEETTTDLRNCEILWRLEVETEERQNKVRLLKPAGRGTTASATAAESEGETTDAKRDEESEGSTGAETESGRSAKSRRSSAPSSEVDPEGR